MSESSFYDKSHAGRETDRSTYAQGTSIFSYGTKKNSSLDKYQNFKMEVHKKEK